MPETDKIHKEIAQAEYNTYTIGREAWTDNGRYIGVPIDFNDNRSGNGEQIYAIASDGSNALPNASLNERVKAKKNYIVIKERRNIERKKVMKKNILVILSILIITILSGCQKKEEVSTYEQDRVAQYILDNLEPVDGSEIKKIEFLSFEKNTSTQIWEISVELNSSYSLFLSEDRLAENLRISRYSDKEIKVKKENVNEVKYIKNIELIYLREEN